MRSQLPLNALRAFEAAARHLSFTNAALELCVTQAAVSHQVKALEERLGIVLFRRLPRGLALTDEGLALVPVLRDSFDRIADIFGQFESGHVREVLTIGVVGTFAAGWLLPRLADFEAAHPFVDLRLFTNNNRVDIAAEGLDYAIRFGDGAWHGTSSLKLLEAPLSPLCGRAIAERLEKPTDLARETLLRSYRADEWSRWFAVTDTTVTRIHGPVFDSSGTMIEAAVQGIGVALAPPAMFRRYLEQDLLRQPFGVTVTTGAYWLTWLKSRPITAAMTVFRDWISAAATG